MSWQSSVESLEDYFENVNRRPKLWLSIFALLMAVQISPWWYPKLDGCRYLSIARSIVNGEEVTSLGQPHLLTTPGYPILISPAFLAGDRPFLLLSILHFALAVICILGVYVWARRHFPSVAVLLTGLAMLNSAVWIHYRRTIKEIAFMAAVIWTVNVMHALLKDRARLRTCCLAVLATVLVTLCAMIRYPGIVLAAGFGFAMLLAAYRGSSSWLRAVTLTLAIGIPPSTTVLWHIQYEKRMAQIYGAATYLTAFQEAVVRGFQETTNGVDEPRTDATESRPTSKVSADPAPAKPTAPAPAEWKENADRVVAISRPKVTTAIANTIAMRAQTNSVAESSGSESQPIVNNQFIEGLRLRISSLGHVTLPGMFKAYSGRGEWLNLNMTIYLTWLILLAVGWWHLCRRKHDIFALSLPLYIILYIIWPFDQGGRFLVPMAPVLMACAWFGMLRLLPLQGKRMLFLAACVIVHFCIAFGYWVGKDAPRAYALHQEWPKVDRIAEIIQANPQPVAIANIDPKRRTKIRVMLELAIDKPVDEYESHKQIDNRVYWMVLPAELPLGNQFTPRERLGRLQLVSRASPEQALPLKTAQDTKPTQTLRR